MADELTKTKKEPIEIVYPERPKEAEVRLERFTEVEVRGGKEQLPSDIIFEDGSSLKIDYRKVERRSPELSQCAYCEGLPTPNPNCPICKGSGECVPMQVASTMDAAKFIKFVQDMKNKDDDVLLELQDLKLGNGIELLRCVREINKERPWLLAKVAPTAKARAEVFGLAGNQQLLTYLGG